MWQSGEEHALGEIEATIPLYNSIDRMIYASWALGTRSQSLVYAEGPAQCEDIAFKIKYLGDDPDIGRGRLHIEPSDLTRDARLKLSSFAKEAVHPYASGEGHLALRS